jgi:uncharacterized protein (DUF1697 family)
MAPMSSVTRAEAPMTRYVALLRGINVGGKNPIPMAGLKACFDENGFADVRTYIQSGNVVFSAPSSNQAELTVRIERMIRSAFNHYDASVILRSRTQIRAIILRAPKGFGSEPTKYRYEVFFIKPPVTAKTAIKDLPVREGVDKIWPGTGVLYSSRLIARATQSGIGKIVSLPIYKSMTIRNWNTTTKLLELLDAADR